MILGAVGGWLYLGPPRDHTSCAMLNDLRVQPRLPLRAPDLSPRSFGQLAIHQIADHHEVIADDRPQLKLLDQSLDTAAHEDRSRWIVRIQELTFGHDGFAAARGPRDFDRYVMPTWDARHGRDVGAIVVCRHDRSIPPAYDN